MVLICGRDSFSMDQNYNLQSLGHSSHGLMIGSYEGGGVVVLSKLTLRLYSNIITLIDMKQVSAYVTVSSTTTLIAMKNNNYCNVGQFIHHKSMQILNTELLQL